MAKLPSEEEVEAANRALEPYKLALGKVAHAWNHMQEQLGLLFCTVSGLDFSMGMALWHSLKSDRTQRDLLEAATTAALQDDIWATRFPQARESIDWLLKQINKLSDRRNSAVHAPIFSLNAGDPELRPLTFFGNPNAKKLQGKGILEEFEWYERCADDLRQYVRLIDHALSPFPGIVGKPKTWPDKPLLPTVGQKSSRPDRSHPPAQE